MALYCSVLYCTFSTVQGIRYDVTLFDCDKRQVTITGAQYTTL